MDKAKLFSAAEKAVVKGQYDKALEAFEQLLKADPMDSKVLNRAADLYLKQGEIAKGVEALVKLAESYSRDGFYSKAVAILKRVLKVDGAGTKESLVNVHEKLAELYGQLGLVSDAMAHFAVVVDVHDRAANQAALLNVLKKVSDLDPYNVDSQLKLAELFVGENQVEEAEEALRRLVETVNAKGHIPDVLRVYERWSELFPKDYQRLKELVDQYIRVGEPKKALVRIQACFKVDPREPQVLELLSQTFVTLKQPEKSRAVDMELIKIYRQAGESEKADVVERRLKGQTPEFSKAAIQSATVSSAANKDDSASPVEELIQATKIDADEKKVLSECDVYVKYGLADKALDVLQQNLSRFSQSLVIRWRLKDICLDKGEVEKAAHLLSEILLLAKSKNLSDWTNVATEALREVDPAHPSLGGAPQPKPKVEEPTKKAHIAPAKKGSDTTAVENIDFKDFEESEISIVLEEEVAEPALEAISEPMPLNEISEPEIVEVSESGGGEALLTEDDFTQAELDQLSQQLAPDPGPLNELELGPSPDNESGPVLELAIDPAPAPVQFSKPTPPPVLDTDFEVKQALEEYDFFKQQGLDSEADQLMKTLLMKHPGHPLLLSKAAKAPVGSDLKSADRMKKKTLQIEALGRQVKVSVQEDERGLGDDSFFDLAGELNKELEANEPKASFEGPAEVRDIFNAFKAGVSQVVSEDDWQTHFDLGVAYREMGLLDDAIQEFKFVQKAKGQAASALYQMGICEVARGSAEKAKAYFDEALKAPDLANQEKISITYELADILLKMNDRSRAISLFQEVKKLDPEFREIDDKLKLAAG